MLGLKQPVLGIVAAIFVMALSIAFVSFFEFPTFGSWVAYLMICLIPMEIVIGITWGTNQPGFAAKHRQPVKGALLAALTVVVGAVVAGDELQLPIGRAAFDFAGFGSVLRGGRTSLFGVIGNAVRLSIVPGHSPQPFAFAEDTLRCRPSSAVLREYHPRLAAFESCSFIDGATRDNHQAIVGRDRELGIAKINACLADDSG